jgi:murein DD-endopeptidase MepM/ murein hydrolase activator NlpD
MGKSDSFVGMLSKLGFNQRQVSSLTSRLAREGGFIATSARTGQQIIVTEKIEGNKRKILAIMIPGEKFNVTIAKNPAGYVQISKVLRGDAPAVEKTRFYYKTGIVQTTIAALGNSLNVPTPVTDKAIRVLSGKVTASTIRKGDKWEVMYEYTYNTAGQQTGLRMLYVSLLSKGVRTEGFRFSPDGRDTGEFFDNTGTSFTKSMLSSPLKGRHKITSGFGYRRHPILGRRLLHTGVDFSARRGEPIYAAGDGTIDKYGRYGGYGNFIRIKHDNTWSTAYAHMSGFARGTSLWKRVKKGEMIGYVGTTGRSTGPHLHFELQKFGTPIDPLRAKLPVGGKKLIAKDLYNFKQEVLRLKNIMNNKAVR